MNSKESKRREARRQRRLTNQRNRNQLKKAAKNMVEQVLVNGGMTGLRQLALELGIPWGRVYGEPYVKYGESSGSVQVSKLSKRVVHKFVEMNWRVV